MKKITLIFVTILLIALMSACSPISKELVNGVWTKSVVDPVSGTTNTLEYSFNDDGTYSYKYNDIEQSNGTYKIKKSLLILKVVEEYDDTTGALVNIEDQKKSIAQTVVCDGEKLAFGFDETSIVFCGGNTDELKGKWRNKYKTNSINEKEKMITVFHYKGTGKAKIIEKEMTKGVKKSKAKNFECGDEWEKINDKEIRITPADTDIAPYTLYYIVIGKGLLISFEEIDADNPPYFTKN